MAYSYCKSCNAPMKPANMFEIREDTQYCEACGKFQEPNRTRDDILEELIDEIAKIKKVFKLLSN